MCFEAIDHHLHDAIERAAENIQIRQRRHITTRAQAIDSHGYCPFGRFQHIHIQVRERHVHFYHRGILSCFSDRSHLCQTIHRDHLPSTRVIPVTIAKATLSTVEQY